MRELCDTIDLVVIFQFRIQKNSMIAIINTQGGCSFFIFKIARNKQLTGFSHFKGPWSKLIRTDFIIKFHN